MLKTARYREEHASLALLIKGFETTLDIALLGKDGAPARRALSELAGKLRLHLAGEDKLLYPQALGSADPAVRKLGEKYQSEMGDLAGAFKAYSDKWLLPKDIAREALSFANESRHIIKALNERIRRENTEFYAAIDKA
ncbi:hemerythrin domain-containing protein [Roseateles sp. DXS20W]|uniref:Hemerythrin domain-containing protein n=1 Tax=Pelomonas lactea TaxID=3299030 RepID=A0ABW7GJE1_9BURK